MYTNLSPLRSLWQKVKKTKLEIDYQSKNLQLSLICVIET